MCGICGVVADKPVEPALLKAMNDTITHRGPDDEGYYIDGKTGIAMRRLSIIDLAAGHQPISNEDGTIWIVFNGEIYNYLALRSDLEQKGHSFSTHTDTECLVHAYEEYGDHFLKRLNGMFGLAIYDSKQQRVLIARDRLGIKPLYYAQIGQQLVFGSEVKALLAYPDVPRDIDFTALDHFLTLEYIPAPCSIFKHIRKLPPGHFMVFEDGNLALNQYWNIEFREDMPPSFEACAEELGALICDAVKIRLMADVPLGAFLSGGIDSSTIVSFMAENTDAPVQTFSIGFGDPTYNELPYAGMVAEKYNTIHTERFLEPDIADLAYMLINHLDEPLGDFSIIPTYLVSKVARSKVTVTLSGDGGDEIFGGYDTYVAQRAARYYDYLPVSIRETLLPTITNMFPPRPAKKGLVNKIKRFVEGGALPPALQHTRWMMFMDEAAKSALYQPDVMVAPNGPHEVMKRYFAEIPHGDYLAQMQYADVKTYMVDDILTKVDRASMAVSLEARVPLLDHRIVEFAMSLPANYKMNKGTTKAILRKVMENRLPEGILNKPKEGFSIPVKHWLKDPLYPMMMDLLGEDSIKRRGYFNPKTVRRWINEHINNRANHSHRLWALMVLEQWQRANLDNVEVRTMQFE